MSIKIGDFALWTSAAEAKALGCTHHARMWGFIPGFYGERESLWVPRTDLCYWLEEAAMIAVSIYCAIFNLEPQFIFQVREEIE